MKKFIITALLAAMPLCTFAQNEFDKFQDAKDVNSISLNSNLFNIAGSLDASDGNDKAQKCMEMVKNIESMKIYSTSAKKQMKSLRNAVSSYIKNNPLEQLMSINGDGSKLKIYVKQGASESIVKEALIFVEDDKDKEVVVMTFTGSINLNDLKNLK